MLQVEKLIERGEALSETYQTNSPFPHIVIDDFLPAEIANKVWELFPKPHKMDPKTFQQEENKIASRPNVPGFPEGLKDVLYALNSHEVITFLEVLTGIDGLVADPHFLGAGLHQTLPGGKLGIHVDFNYHKHLRLNRRLNLLIFFNKNWKEEYGGHLELWEETMTSCQKRILPVFNRCVIFNTGDQSYHGHPDLLRCPHDSTRKSIALYYYSSGRPEDNAKEVFWTEHQKRPGAEDYKFSPGTSGSGSSLIRRIGREITPPVLQRILKRIMNQNGSQGRN